MRSVSSPSARAATRVRAGRPTGGTSPFRRRAPARHRFSRWRATARTFGRSRGPATITSPTGQKNDDDANSIGGGGGRVGRAGDGGGRVPPQQAAGGAAHAAS